MVSREAKYTTSYYYNSLSLCNIEIRYVYAEEPRSIATYIKEDDDENKKKKN